MCEACVAAKTDPKTDWFGNGCTSCTGRALAVMGYRRDELSARQPADVVKAFEQWVPLVRRHEAQVQR